MTAYADKPLTGKKCECGNPAWGVGWRCRTCIAEERESAATYGPAEMLKDVILTTRPRFQMEVQQMAREGAVFYLNPELEEQADHNLCADGG